MSRPHESDAEMALRLQSEFDSLPVASVSAPPTKSVLSPEHTTGGPLQGTVVSLPPDAPTVVLGGSSPPLNPRSVYDGGYQSSSSHSVSNEITNPALAVASTVPPQDSQGATGGVQVARPGPTTVLNAIPIMSYGRTEDFDEIENMEGRERLVALFRLVEAHEHALLYFTAEPFSFLIPSLPLLPPPLVCLVRSACSQR